MSRRGGGCLTAVAVVLSLLVVALGAGLLYLVLTNQTPDVPGVSEQTPELGPKAFEEYTWEELSQVAHLISEASSEDEARSVAESYNVSVGSTRPLTLTDGRQASLTVVGIRADRLAEGEGFAGLTLMASPISVQPMNSAQTNEGGWEGSELRSWLATEGMALLPDELASSIAPVKKLTNNTGVTSDPAAVTETADALWLFSGSEVCGPITWFTDEYGTGPNAYTGYVNFVPYDELLSSEGSQYEYFSAAGVSAQSDPNGTLRLTYGGSETSWWYRSSYPYSFTGEDASFFFQVMASGFPSTTGLASEPSGVTVGLCL